MPGEESKKSGDHGEAVIENIFKDLLGFPIYRTNIPNLKCESQEEHAKLRSNQSNTHGLDGLVHYNSPLKSEVLEIGYISVKHTKNKYPGSPRSKFKSHFIDLATALECFHYSDEKKDIEGNSTGVKSTNVTGILFWLSNEEGDSDNSILENLAKSQLESLQIVFDRIIVVDSARLQFIHQTVSKVKLISQNNYSFVYPSTGLNFKANFNENFGDIFPLEFFAYDIIPMRFTVRNNVYFILSCRDNIDEDHLAQLISLAKTFDKLEATTNIFLSFKDYNSYNHDDMIIKVKGRFTDNSFTKLIKVVSHDSDFKNLTNLE
jgi:hypothetical protein